MAKKSDETAVEPVKTGGEMAVYDYGQNSGLGFDVMGAEDVRIPYLVMLQALSPEVGQDPQHKVKGAAVGMLMNTVTKECWDGDKGLIFVPCERVRAFPEWIPRKQGGGLVGMHAPESDVVLKARQRNGGSTIGLKSEAGNDLAETFYLYGLVLENENDTSPQFAACIAFKSTMIKGYRDTMSALQSVKGLKAPLFAHRLRVTTFADKNAQGAFSNIRMRPVAWKEGVVTDADIRASLVSPSINGKPNPILEAGLKLLESVRGGTAQVDVNSERPVSTEKSDPVF